jgi:hypothetical protein
LRRSYHHEDELVGIGKSLDQQIHVANVRLSRCLGVDQTAEQIQKLKNDVINDWLTETIKEKQQSVTAFANVTQILQKIHSKQIPNMEEEDLQGRAHYLKKRIEDLTEKADVCSKLLFLRYKMICMLTWAAC